MRGKKREMNPPFLRKVYIFYFFRARGKRAQTVAPYEGLGFNTRSLHVVILTTTGLPPVLVNRLGSSSVVCSGNSYHRKWWVLPKQPSSRSGQLLLSSRIKLAGSPPEGPLKNSQNTQKHVPLHFLRILIRSRHLIIFTREERGRSFFSFSKTLSILFW